ncbi:hypothetical protein DS837_00970 [Azospirillum brasilense]|uniref:Uncharacterized protein n=1 Tax=Azospirillum brasilense TaxID=192 RepID=A0A6L3B5P7_AZOBR|nr:hypothetical protein DS837_00970 [Azospirillum brasilense]
MNEWPSPLRSRANDVCADAAGGPFRRKRGEGRGPRRTGVGRVRGMRVVVCSAKAHPPHPDPLPGGERGFRPLTSVEDLKKPHKVLI